MATLAANDQENAARHLHAGPAGKSLNAGPKAFGAKTPGNKAPKTPFKIPLNDENAPNKAGKSVLKANGKGNENALFTARKGGKLDDSAFVTPAGMCKPAFARISGLTCLGPRTRAPLGMKTTNAKSRAFQTPAPLSSTKTQKVSPRLRRPKVKVHQPEFEHESNDDIPEIEYMAPKDVPLEDDMGDYLPKDWTIPRISDDAMRRSIWEAHHNPVEDDGRTRKQREFEEEVQRERKQRDAEFDKVFAAQMAKDDAEARRYLGIEKPEQGSVKSLANVAPARKATTGLSTMKSRSAAAAFSTAIKSSVAVPSESAKPRAPSRLALGKKTAKPPAEPSAARKAAAVASSKSTIGYAQGRIGRTGPAARMPLSNVTRPAPFSNTSRQPSALPSSRHRGAANDTASIRSRTPISRRSSTSTNATFVPPEQGQQVYRTAESVERELELMILSGSDDEGDEAWSNSFNSQLLRDGVDDELEDFQLQLPEGF